MFFAAGIYLTLSRIIVHYGVRYSWLTPKRISITFMTSDIIALVLQAAGGVIADTANTKKLSNIGTHILVAGLAFQVLSLLFFINVSCHYAMKVLRLMGGKDTVVQDPHQYLRTRHLYSRATRRFNISLVDEYSLILLDSKILTFTRPSHCYTLHPLSFCIPCCRTLERIR